MILRIVSAITCFACSIVHFSTQALEWHVLPQQCIVSSKGEPCISVLEVRISKMGKSALCLYIDNKRANCFVDLSEANVDIPIEISANVLLELKNPQGNPVKSMMIEYTLIEDKPKRRRVRLPWSVF